MFYKFTNSHFLKVFISMKTYAVKGSGGHREILNFLKVPLGHFTSSPQETTV